MNATRIVSMFGSLAVIIPTIGLSHPMDSRVNSGVRPCPIGFDANRDGKVTRDEVRAIRSDHFVTADRNGDGTLTVDEYSALPHQGAMMGRGRMLARLDADHDGRLSKTEFANFVPPRLAAMGLGENGVVSSSDTWMRHGWRGGMWAR
ncbi:MAG: EF-hand domain-containing protein [Nitrospirae bacterium]|nr:EF-hand domain-containing protein [Magnetococcales bacterium]